MEQTLKTVDEPDSTDVVENLMLMKIIWFSSKFI